MDNNRQTALITGASSGIGYEFSQLLAAEGYNTVLVARRQDKLETQATELRQKYSGEVTVLARDLIDPAASAEIFDELQDRGIQVDVLINNAGFGDHAAFAQADTGKLLDMLQLNVVALTHLARLFLPGMLERGRGASSTWALPAHSARPLYGRVCRHESLRTLALRSAARRDEKQRRDSHSSMPGLHPHRLPGDGRRRSG